MPLRLSKGLRNSMLADAFLIGATLSYSDNGASPDTIIDSASNFIKAGFRVGDSITTTNSTTGGNDISGVAITAVAAGTLSVATGTLAASEVFAATTTVTSNNGESFQEKMKDGVIRIYSGSQPSSADAAETGTLLALITLSSGAFVAGVATNGLEFGPILEGVVAKLAAEVWSGVCLATGTAGWFRFYSNDVDTGADETSVRFDGSVGTSGATLNLSSTSLTLGATVTIDTFALTLPAS